MIAAAGFLLGLFASLSGGYAWYLYLRRRINGTLGRLLPKRREILPDSSFTGAAFAGLSGLVLAFLICALLLFLSGEKFSSYIPGVMLCVMLLAVGTLEDYLTLRRGVKGGLKTPARILYLAFCGSVFAVLHISFGGDSLISLPFMYGAVRTSAYFCPVVTILTVILCEALRLSAGLEGSGCVISLGAFVSLGVMQAAAKDTAGLAFVLICSGAAAGMLFWSYEPSYLKCGSGGRYFLAGMMISAAFLSNEEGSVVFAFLFCLIISLAAVVDFVYFMAKKRHLFF